MNPLRALAVLAMVATFWATLPLASRTVLAKTIVCTVATCAETGRADRITGARVGNSSINGRGGDDRIVGGGGGSRQAKDRDTVFGGGDNDGSNDEVDCGPGRDTVLFDEGFDTVANCEELNPA